MPTQLLSQQHGGRSLASDAARVIRGLHLVGMLLVNAIVIHHVMLCTSVGTLGPFTI